MYSHDSVYYSYMNSYMYSHICIHMIVSSHLTLEYALKPGYALGLRHSTSVE